MNWATPQAASGDSNVVISQEKIMKLHKLFPIDGTQVVGFSMIDPAEEAAPGRGEAKDTPGAPPAGHTPAGGGWGDVPDSEPAADPARRG